MFTSVRAPLHQPGPGDGPAEGSGELHMASSISAARVQGWGCPRAAGSPAPSQFCLSVLVLCPETGGTKDRMGTSCESINKPEKQLSPQPSGLQQLLCSSTAGLVWTQREMGSVMNLECEVQLQLL